MINFTQGDSAILSLTATDGDGNAIDLTGAVFTTYIKGLNGVVVSFPNAQHTANPDQVTHPGQFTLSLTIADTSSCSVGTNKEIITKIVITPSTIYYRGVNALNVHPAVPLQ